MNYSLKTRFGMWLTQFIFLDRWMFVVDGPYAIFETKEGELFIRKHHRITGFMQWFSEHGNRVEPGAKRLLPKGWGHV